jgi:hypothetical protein
VIPSFSSILRLPSSANRRHICLLKEATFVALFYGPAEEWHIVLEANPRTDFESTFVEVTVIVSSVRDVRVVKDAALQILRHCLVPQRTPPNAPSWESFGSFRLLGSRHCNAPLVAGSLQCHLSPSCRSLPHDRIDTACLLFVRSIVRNALELQLVPENQRTVHHHHVYGESGQHLHLFVTLAPVAVVQSR